ncbi:MAG: IS30 family transposase [Candidatus Dormibacteraceae bacterium]
MRGRAGFPRHIRREFWRLIAAGEQTEAAATAVGVSRTVSTRWFSQAGGMTPLALNDPSGRYLSITEREEIAVLSGHVSVREIARRLSRSPSTISRELKRNGPSGHGQYRAGLAQAHAERRLRRPKVSKLATCEALREYVQTKLGGVQRWSPEQIARRLRVDFPEDDGMRISHEAIYQALYVQGRGSLRRELSVCLRTGRALRRPRRRVDSRRTRWRIKNMVMISERPAEAADRAVPGHWEGDLILGQNSVSAIGTLVERTTRFTMLLHLPGDREGHRAEAVRDGIGAAILTLPAHLRRSLTWDQGLELLEHVDLNIATDLDIYFCDPHSPWQRGTNENTNGLLRQYFPKSTDLSVHSAADLVNVAAALNGRPRKTLGWKTPAEAFTALLLKSA